jgi:two-component system, NarL family, response regulator NreC
MSTRILIADDNEVARSRLTQFLEYRGGWEVCGAVENGQQALVKATELNPDLIILDLAMPQLDGLQATREIGQILPSVPILIFTLYVATGLALEAKNAGAREVVSKGNAETLLTAIESVLSKGL